MNMKFSILSVMILMILGAPTVQAEDYSKLPAIPADHFYTHQDKDGKRHYIENWYEVDPVEGKVNAWRIALTVDLPVATSTSVKPPALPPSNPSGDLPGPWYCYSNDFINGHQVGDTKEDSCIRFYYLGKGECRDDAMGAALLECQSKSENKETCELVARNCFRHSQKFWNNHKR